MQYFSQAKLITKATNSVYNMLAKIKATNIT